MKPQQPAQTHTAARRLESEIENRIAAAILLERIHAASAFRPRPWLLQEQDQSARELPAPLPATLTIN